MDTWRKNVLGRESSERKGRKLEAVSVGGIQETNVTLAEFVSHSRVK